MADLDEFAAIHRQIHQQNFAHLFKDQHFLFEERKESEGQPLMLEMNTSLLSNANINTTNAN